MSVDIKPVFITITLDKEKIADLVSLSEDDTIDFSGIDTVVRSDLVDDTDVFRILVWGYGTDEDFNKIVKSVIKLFSKIKITVDGFVRREEMVLSMKLDKMTTPSGIQILTYTKTD